MPARLTITAAVLLAAVLAGCTGPEPEPGFGAHYGARVTGSQGCTVHLPWPYLNSTAFGPLTAGPGTTAELVTTEYGRAVRVTGAGDLAVNATRTGPTPFGHRLSMQQSGWTAANGTADEGSYWLRAQGCAGATLDLSWFYDEGPRLAYGVTIESTLTDGWVETAAQRTQL